MPEQREQAVAEAAASAPRAARLATAVIFALHGLVFAAWTPYIPLVKQRLGLNDATLGLTLLGGPVGALLAIMVVGSLTARWGSRRVTTTAMVGYGLSAAALGLAPSAPWLFLVLGAWGACQGGMDLAMNAQAVVVEQGYGRPIMSSFHACWSLGAFAGTGIGMLGVALGLSLTTHLAIVGGLAAVAVQLLGRVLLRGDHAVEETRRGGSPLVLLVRDRRLLALGALMLAALLCEGAAADWAALYFTDSLGTSAALAGSGFAVFAVAMFVGRAMGDRWVARYGAKRVMRTLAAAAAAVLGSALLVAQPWAALLGFVTLGLGLACGVPVVMSAAGRLPGQHTGRALAAVSTAAWPGFLVGPPLIGGLAHLVSLRVALFTLPVLCAGMALGARVLGPGPGESLSPDR